MVEGVLNRLDEYMANYCLPTLAGSESELLAAQMRIFSDTNTWLIVIEYVFCEYGATDWGDVCTIRYLYGTCPTSICGRGQMRCDIKDLAGSAPLFPDVDDDVFDMPEHYVNVNAHECEIAGKAVDISQLLDQLTLMPDDKSLATDWLVLDGGVRALAREVVKQYQETMWSTESTLSSLVGFLPGMILCLYDWWHPNMVLGQKPSDSLSFQQIAQCIVNGSDKAYSMSQPTNMHYSYWRRFDP